MLDALKLMRIPFSIFLMPVYWFALSASPQIDWSLAVPIFIIIHLFLYPASNGYNSYFDRDEGSIGGLKKPPKVNSYLFPLVLAFDGIAILAASFISIFFGLCILIYTLVSKAYSYDKIRLKKYPIISTLVVTTFQGFFMFLTTQVGLGIKWDCILAQENLLLALVSTIFLMGSYPLTQVYQHEEDQGRGDKTLSILLGIRGTFYFSAISFLVGVAILSTLLLQLQQLNQLIVFLIASGPILMYFTQWFLLVVKDEKNANFDRTMKMNMISSVCLSAAFIAMIVSRLF